MEKQFHINDVNSLFDDVQRAEIFEDQKTMTDLIPLFPVSEIKQKYETSKFESNFDLKSFVLSNFEFLPNKTPEEMDKLPILDHIERLWDYLEYSAKENIGTLLQLPNPYIVPGGRFKEFFYWDSYFVLLGLQVSKRTDMMKNIVENCSYLIQNLGFVPNASRNYFLSRSQPPFFSLMVTLLAETLNDENIYKKYYDSLKKEYKFWMDDEGEITDFSGWKAVKRLIKIPDGNILNRYYDAENLPRPESYLIDIKDNEKRRINNTNITNEFYRCLRSACESGWDFSSRWFADNKNIETIETLNISQIDLNCLLWHLESILAKTSKLVEDKQNENFYLKRAEQRKQMINKCFWDENAKIYRDFHLKKQTVTESEHIASLYPLYIGIASEEQANYMAENVRNKFLQAGGLLTTTNNTGQQWDSPNAWAPLQWIGYVSMSNYGFLDLANEIKTNWCKNVERVYENIGKLTEKYNAIDISQFAGGGEYPNQDGFGWTNGVYQKFRSI